MSEYIKNNLDLNFNIALVRNDARPAYLKEYNGCERYGSSQDMFDLIKKTFPDLHYFVIKRTKGEPVRYLISKNEIKELTQRIC